jgi:predicted metal-dependent hydrolase
MLRKPVKRPERRLRAEPIDRAATARRAMELFNGGGFWEAHEALETIWRSVADQDQALVLQGLIQAAAALLHRERGNQHGVSVVGQAALDKLKGRQHPAIEFETEQFSRDLAQALRQGGPAPRLRLKDS